jgi:hypothetical protein
VSYSLRTRRPSSSSPLMWSIIMARSSRPTKDTSYAAKGKYLFVVCTLPFPSIF